MHCHNSAASFVGCCSADKDHPDDMTDREVDKLIVVTSAKKGSKQALDQQLIDDGLALYQEQLSEVGTRVQVLVDSGGV